MSAHASGDEVTSITPAGLKARIDAGDPVTILDVRAASEYEAWRIDGESVADANVPYFEFLGDVDESLLGRIPEGDPVVAVCAKGEASAMVAGVLKDHGIEAVNLEDGMNGWAGLYESMELEAATPATVLQYSRPSSGCLAYLVVHGGEAAVIDPLRAFADRYVEDADALGVELTYAIDTHVHADHVSGLRAVRDRTGAAAVVGAPVAARGITFDVATVGNGDTIEVGDTALEAVHAPGHTTGMTAFLIDDAVLCSGDALFLDGVPRPDLEGGEDGAPALAGTLHSTLHDVLLALPDNVLVAPGHIDEDTERRADGSFTATLGEVRGELPLLELDRDAFVDEITVDMPPRPANVEAIVEINLGGRDADDDEAFRLELGPNNCAAG